MRYAPLRETSHERQEERHRTRPPHAQVSQASHEEREGLHEEGQAPRAPADMSDEVAGDDRGPSPLMVELTRRINHLSGEMVRVVRRGPQPGAALCLKIIESDIRDAAMRRSDEHVRLLIERAIAPR